MAAVINNQINKDQLVMAKSITIDGGGASAMIIYGAGQGNHLQYTIHNIQYTLYNAQGREIT